MLGFPIPKRFKIEPSNDGIVITNTCTNEKATYTQNQYVAITDQWRKYFKPDEEDMFLQALVEPEKRLEHWILEVESNSPNDPWLTALRALMLERFGPRVTRELAKPVVLSPEEEEKRKQLAFFKGSSHDPDDPWSPARRS